MDIQVTEPIKSVTGTVDKQVTNDKYRVLVSLGSKIVLIKQTMDF